MTYTTKFRPYPSSPDPSIHWVSLNPESYFSYLRPYSLTVSIDLPYTKQDLNDIRGLSGERRFVTA